METTTSTQLSPDDALEHLVYGYMKNAFLKHYERDYPTPLNIVIATFLGNILLQFDVYPSSLSHMIKNYGKTIDAYDLEKHTQSVMIGCSYGVTEGVHDFKVKCVKPNPVDDDTIGIITTIDDCKREMWGSDVNGLSIYYYENSGCYQYDNHAFVLASDANWNQNWKVDDIITVHIDLDKLELSFYINDKLIGETMTVPKDQTWYLTMCIEGQGSEYQKSIR